MPLRAHLMLNLSKYARSSCSRASSHAQKSPLSRTDPISFVSIFLEQADGGPAVGA
jgi:hypothetical protein